MGQQQLLLIVLGVIIVGIAIVVGITLFQASAVQANRDAITSDLQHLAFTAQQYYKKPTILGGGGNSFVGYSLPTGLSSNVNGTYVVSSVAANQVVFTGTGTEKNDAGQLVQYQSTVTNTSVVTVVVR